MKLKTKIVISLMVVALIGGFFLDKNSSIRFGYNRTITDPVQNSALVSATIRSAFQTLENEISSYFTIYDTNYGVSVFSTTTVPWFKSGLTASSTSYLTTANVTTFNVSGLFSSINASTTLLSVFSKGYFGGTATSTFDSLGNLALVSNGLTVGSTQLVVSGGNVGVGSSTPYSNLSVVSGGSIVVGENNLSTTTSMTINWSSGNQQLIRKGTAGITLTFSNYVDGQKLIIIACNPGSGTAGTFTWPSVVLWSGGTSPSQTTTAQKCDIYSFLATKATSSVVILGASNTSF